MVTLNITPSPPTASIATNPDTAACIIATMLHSDRTIPEIADEFRLSFAQMMALLETPEAKAEIEAIGKLSVLREQLRAPIRRETALHRLAHIVAYSLNEPEARRAASTLVKQHPPAQCPSEQRPNMQHDAEQHPAQNASKPESTAAHQATDSPKDKTITTPAQPEPHNEPDPLPMCDVAMCDVATCNVPCDALPHGRSAPDATIRDRRRAPKIAAKAIASLNSAGLLNDGG
jgi:hypothetical protein